MFALPALPLVAAGISAFGTYQQGQQAAGAYGQNAAIALEQAKATRTRAELSTFQKQKNLESAIGQQRSQYAAAGVSVLVGSPVDVMVDTLSKGYLDQAIDRYNNEVAARGFESEAAMDRYKAKQVKRESLLKAGLGLFEAGVKYDYKPSQSSYIDKYSNEGVMG